MTSFYASPAFPRLLNAETIKQTIARGVQDGLLAYVGKGRSGTYIPFIFERSLDQSDVEVSDETFIVTRETALAFRETQTSTVLPVLPISGSDDPLDIPGSAGVDMPSISARPEKQTKPQSSQTGVRSLTWNGEVPPQKWMNFYTRVLSKFATAAGLSVTVRVDITPEGGVTEQKIEETRSALRELGLSDVLDREP